MTRIIKYKNVFENWLSGLVARVENVVSNGATRSHMVLTVYYEYIMNYKCWYGEISIIHLELKLGKSRITIFRKVLQF